MKVKYVKYRRMHTSTVLNPVYWSEENKDPNLTLGNIYHVLMLRIARDKADDDELILCRESDSYPVCFNLNDFEMVDNNIPSDWVVDMTGSRWIDLYPRELNWEFWDKFHDGDEAAEALFEQVYQRIIQS